MKNLKRLDNELAKIIFLLFKKNIEGGVILKEEMKDVILSMKTKGKVTSKISRQLFEHPDFYASRKEPKEIKIY